MYNGKMREEGGGGERERGERGMEGEGKEKEMV